MTLHIFKRFKLGDNAIKVHLHLTDSYGKSCISGDAIKRWDQHFRDWKINTEESKYVPCHLAAVWNKQTLFWVNKVIKKIPTILYIGNNYVQSVTYSGEQWKEFYIKTHLQNYFCMMDIGSADIG